MDISAFKILDTYWSHIWSMSTECAELMRHRLVLFQSRVRERITTQAADFIWYLTSSVFSQSQRWIPLQKSEHFLFEISAHICQNKKLIQIHSLTFNHIRVCAFLSRISDLYFIPCWRLGSESYVLGISKVGLSVDDGNLMTRDQLTRKYNWENVIQTECMMKLYWARWSNWTSCCGS